MKLFRLSIFFSLFLNIVSFSQNTTYNNFERKCGGIIRTDQRQKVISLVFTGHEFADGGEVILNVLKKHNAKASFFFTGDFYRTDQFAPLIRSFKKEGHYLGAHSDKHLLYCTWEKRDSLLVTKQQFVADLLANYMEMERFGISSASVQYFLPPYEWYNDSITAWTKELGLTLMNFTSGTSSNADWTYPELGKQYVPTDTIYNRILRYEASAPNGLNGFILLLHIGIDPCRPDPFYYRLDNLLSELETKGYRFTQLHETIPLSH